MLRHKIRGSSTCLGIQNLWLEINATLELDVFILDLLLDNPLNVFHEYVQIKLLDIKTQFISLQLIVVEEVMHDVLKDI